MSARLFPSVPHVSSGRGGHGAEAVTPFLLPGHSRAGIPGNGSFGCRFPSGMSVEGHFVTARVHVAICLLTSLLCCLPLPHSDLLLRESSENPFLLSAGVEPSPAGRSELPLAQPGQGSHQPQRQLEPNDDRKLLRWLGTSFAGGALPASGSAAIHVFRGVCPELLLACSMLRSSGCFGYSSRFALFTLVSISPFPLFYGLHCSANGSVMLQFTPSADFKLFSFSGILKRVIFVQEMLSACPPWVCGFHEQFLHAATESHCQT